MNPSLILKNQPIIEYLRNSRRLRKTIAFYLNSTVSEISQQSSLTFLRQATGSPPSYFLEATRLSKSLPPNQLLQRWLVAHPTVYQGRSLQPTDFPLNYHPEID